MWNWQQTASWQDFAALTGRMASGKQALRRKFWRRLKREAASLPFVEELLTAHYCAFDRQTPLYVKGILVGAIVYFVVPDRFIPQIRVADRACRRRRGARRGLQGRFLAHQARAQGNGAAHARAAARIRGRSPNPERHKRQRDKDLRCNNRTRDDANVGFADNQN